MARVCGTAGGGAGSVGFTRFGAEIGLHKVFIPVSVQQPFYSNNTFCLRLVTTLGVEEDGSLARGKCWKGAAGFVRGKFWVTQGAPGVRRRVVVQVQRRHRDSRIRGGATIALRLRTALVSGRPREPRSQHRGNTAKGRDKRSGALTKGKLQSRAVSGLSRAWPWQAVRCSCRHLQLHSSLQVGAISSDGILREKKAVGTVETQVNGRDGQAVALSRKAEAQRKRLLRSYQSARAVPAARA